MILSATFASPVKVIVPLEIGSAKLDALTAVSGLFQLSAELQGTRVQQITLLF